ncbi:MAG: Fe2+-dependent dioxygenase [Alphaproteobacteria bacterium]
MFMEIKELLSQTDVARLNALAQEVKFVDGRISNPANPTKTNFQADLTDPKYKETSQIVAAAMARSREFNDFAFPKRIAPPLMLRYDLTQKYGVHADAAYMQVPGGSLRSDVSCTVFISDPASYQGGELTIHLGVRPLTIKGSPGDCILYPSTTLHEVQPVRSGIRIVSISFIESFVPDEVKRNLLWELNEVGALEGLNMKWENRVRFEAARNNLFRMWSA